jgi:hypothetical protein
MKPETPLRCGPLVRYTSKSEAVIWVELAQNLEIEVRLWAVSPHRSRVPLVVRAWPVQVGESFYAWVACRFLLSKTWYEYEVYGREFGGGAKRLWPNSQLTLIPRPSIFRTLPGMSLDRLKVAYGSCRKGNSPLSSSEKDIGFDALRRMAERMHQSWNSRDQIWPHLCLFMGDQVYVDDLSKHAQAELRRIGPPRGVPKRAETFDQYAAVYREAWIETPEVRWLLSCMPSFMIFDDHEIHDDWNITEDWVAARRGSLAWRRTLRDGLLAYWIYQGAGNLPPGLWSRDERMRPLVPRIRRVVGDVTHRMERLFEAYATGRQRADWGCAFEAAGARILMADTRMHRKLTGRRLIMDEQAWKAFVANCKATTRRHLLLVLPGPFLTHRALHELLSIAGAYLEQGSAPGDLLQRGFTIEGIILLKSVLPGLVGKYIQEKAIDDPDAELWASFPTSFSQMLGLLEELYNGQGTLAKKSVTLLSGDVHHSFVMRGELNDTLRRSPFLNITCSPIRRLDESEDEKRNIYGGKWYDPLHWLRLFGTPPFVAEQRRRCRWYPLTKPDGQHRGLYTMDDWAFWGTSQGQEISGGFLGWIEFEGLRVRYGIERASPTNLMPIIEGKMLALG